MLRFCCILALLLAGGTAVSTQSRPTAPSNETEQAKLKVQKADNHEDIEVEYEPQKGTTVRPTASATSTTSETTTTVGEPSTTGAQHSSAAAADVIIEPVHQASRILLGSAVQTLPSDGLKVQVRHLMEDIVDDMDHDQLYTLAQSLIHDDVIKVGPVAADAMAQAFEDGLRDVVSSYSVSTIRSLVEKSLETAQDEHIRDHLHTVLEENLQAMPAEDVEAHTVHAMNTFFTNHPNGKESVKRQIEEEIGSMHNEHVKSAITRILKKVDTVPDSYHQNAILPGTTSESQDTEQRKKRTSKRGKRRGGEKNARRDGKKSKRRNEKRSETKREHNERLDPDTATDTRPDRGLAPDTRPDRGLAPDTRPQGVAPDTIPDRGVAPDTTRQELASGTRPQGEAPDAVPGTGVAPDVKHDERLASGTDNATQQTQGVASDTRPNRGLAPDTRPQGVAPDRRPNRGLAPDTRSQGVAPDTRPDRGLAPDTRPDRGLAPDTRPDRGLAPDTRPKGVTPDTRSDRGTASDTRPHQLVPDTLPDKDLAPDTRQQGVAPDTRPQGVTPDTRPQGVTPDTRPQGVTPDTKPQGVAPDAVPAIGLALDTRPDRRLASDTYGATEQTDTTPCPKSSYLEQINELEANDAVKDKMRRLVEQIFEEPYADQIQDLKQIGEDIRNSATNLQGASDEPVTALVEEIIELHKNK